MVAEQQVWKALANCYDPEIPVNIVDLGLIYDVTIQGAGVRVTMTLTARGCPMHNQIAATVKHALEQVEGIESAEVLIVWDPQWDPSMMTAAGRQALGL